MRRHINMLLFVFVGLAALAFCIWKINQPKKQHQNIPLLNGTMSAVVSFELNNFTLGLLFKLENGQWMVQQHPNALTRELEQKAQVEFIQNTTSFAEAKTDDINEILTDLFSLSDLEVVATQKAESNVFEINPHSLHLIFYNAQGQEIDRLFFGKQGPLMGTAYIKKGNSNTVYLLDRGFSVSLLRPYKDWLVNPPQDTEKKPDGKKKK